MDIEPVVITTTKIVNSFVIVRLHVELNSRAEIQVALKNNDEYILFENIILEGEDYDNWGSDDEYVINYIKSYIINKYS